MGVGSNLRKPSKMSRVRRRLKSRVSVLPVAVLGAILVTVAVPAYKLYHKVHVEGPALSESEGVEMLPLFRDIYTQEEWPGVEWNHTTPDQAHPTVHYLWCGQKTFRYQDYLGVLSILRVVQPLKLVFHFSHLPQPDPLWYHTWFQELTQSAHNVVLRRLTPEQQTIPCGSVDMLRVALGFLSLHGGVFVGEGVVLAQRLAPHLQLLPFWFAFTDSSPSLDVTSGVVFVSRGFNEFTLEDYLRVITASSPTCLSVGEYEREIETEKEREEYERELEKEKGGAYDGVGKEEADLLSPRDTFVCVGLTGDIYPRDVLGADSPFAELARWLFYGRRGAAFPEASGRLAPRLAHYTWMAKPDAGLQPQEGEEAGQREFTFTHYLSVLSALHVAGMRHVYVHGDVTPQGAWWAELRSENVTFVRLETPDTVFQQRVATPDTASDIVRYNVLYKYGGVYQDPDVVWVNHVPDWLLGYPAVAGPEWPRGYGEWPDSLNLGVIIARRHAPFLRHFLSTYRYFRDGDWNFNAVLMPYRTYEWYPDTLYLDPYLQAICSYGECHPAWADNEEEQEVDDSDPYQQASQGFSLDSVRAVHLRSPGQPESLSSPAALRAGRDMLADLGRFVLEQSGRLDLLEK